MKPQYVLLLLLSILFTISAADILPGSTLYASNPSQTWTSPNNTFSLGFITESPNTHFAAITYSGIPVWKAGVAVDTSASLHFDPDGDLRLVSGGSVVWRSNTAGRGVSSAALDDEGNFVLKNGTVSVWTTFDNPTDTLLPTQNFTVNNVLRSGLYSFRLLSSGNLTLIWNDSSIVYWNMGINTNLSSPILGLQPNGTYFIFDPTLSRPVIMAYSNDYGEGTDILRFIKLDSDGNLRMYSSGRGSGTKNLTWVAVSDQCQVFGYCGNMGICRYNGTDPVCGCPSQNFDPVDPRDSRKGCKRKVEINNCRGSETMLQLDNAILLTYPRDFVAVGSSQVFFQTITPCRMNCLVSGSCVASTSLVDGTGLCFMKLVPDFISGYQSPALPSTSYVKVCGPVRANPSFSSRNDDNGWQLQLEMWKVAVLVVGSLLGFVMLEGFLWWWCRNRLKLSELRSSQHDYSSAAPVQFSYKDLQLATKGFKDKIGGGFGVVYKGVLANRTVVAVKEVEEVKQFRVEFATISSIHHLNLARLIGFCFQGHYRFLVYELPRNGSLENFLFSTESVKLLNWKHRFNIAHGTAKGIAYLHEECRDCIVHGDIKPENILLDENYDAKVSGFGLEGDSRRTRGYLAPEWIITCKSDVYSYGMVLLEIVSGRRNFEVSEETKWKKFSEWAYEEFEKGNVEAIVDKRLVGYEVNMEEVIRAIMVSFWCIQEEPSKRPMMGKVVHMLVGIIEIVKPPIPKNVERSEHLLC